MIKISGIAKYTKNIYKKTSNNDEYNPDKYIFNILPDVDTIEISKSEKTDKKEIFDIITKRLKEIGKGDEKEWLLQFTPSNYEFSIIGLNDDEKLESGALVEVAFTIEYKKKYKNYAFLVKGIKVIENGEVYNPFNEFEEKE